MAQSNQQHEEFADAIPDGQQHRLLRGHGGNLSMPQTADDGTELCKSSQGIGAGCLTSVEELSMDMNQVHTSHRATLDMRGMLIPSFPPSRLRRTADRGGSRRYRQADRVVSAFAQRQRHTGHVTERHYGVHRAEHT